MLKKLKINLYLKLILKKKNKFNQLFKKFNGKKNMEGKENLRVENSLIIIIIILCLIHLILFKNYQNLKDNNNSLIIKKMVKKI